METFKLKHDIQVSIINDDNPDSPRDWDNLGTMLYTSSHYVLGDTQTDLDHIEDTIKRKDVLYLNVYAYIHGWVKLSTSGFSCPWDSGQCGIIYADFDTIKENYGIKRITKKIKERVYQSLKNEVKTFSDYCEGEVYGYTVKRGNDCLDSVWGFYGYDYTKNEALNIGAYWVKEYNRLDAINSTGG